MTPGSLIGWLVLLSLLLGVSAALVLLTLWPLERAAVLRLRWPLRLALIAIVAAALWAAIPVAVQYLYSAA